MNALKKIAIAAALSLAASFAASAQQAAAPAAAIELTGIGSAAISLTPEALAGLPVIEKDVTFQTAKGPSSGHYKGVLVWDLLQANKAFEGLDRNGELAKTLLMTAKDGYRIAFSVGEIHPDFGNTPLMLATEVDGKPVEEGPRIVAPGDTRGARAIYSIATIELR